MQATVIVRIRRSRGHCVLIYDVIIAVLKPSPKRVLDLQQANTTPGYAYTHSCGTHAADSMGGLHLLPSYRCFW